jgi:hypothetical protein
MERLGGGLLIGRALGGEASNTGDDASVATPLARWSQSLLPCQQADLADRAVLHFCRDTAVPDVEKREVGVVLFPGPEHSSAYVSRTSTAPMHSRCTIKIRKGGRVQHAIRPTNKLHTRQHRLLITWL